MAEVKVYEVLGLCRCHITSLADRTGCSADIDLVNLEVGMRIYMFQLSTYRELRSCQSYGRQCSAKSGLFARPSMSLYVVSLISYSQSQTMNSRRLADCSLDMLCNVLSYGVSPRFP